MYVQNPGDLVGSDLVQVTIGGKFVPDSAAQGGCMVQCVLWS